MKPKKQTLEEKQSKKKGITLIALVVTITVIVILATIILSLLFRKDGIIERSRYAKFVNDYYAIEERVKLYKMDKQIDDEVKQQKTLQLPVLSELTDSEKQEIKNKVPTLQKQLEKESGISIDNLNLYWIDKEAINTKNKHKYIINSKTMRIYDYEGEEISGEILHTPDSKDLPEKENEEWDGWIRLTLHYPDNATNRMWRLGEEGEVRSNVNLEWDEYTGPITIPISRVKDVWIKYDLDDNEVVEAPDGVVLVDIQDEKTDKKGVHKVKIVYDEAAVVKQYNIDGTGWRDYTKEFTVEKDTLVMARAKIVEEIKDNDGNVITKQDKWGKDNKYIYVNIENDSDKENAKKDGIPDKIQEIVDEQNNNVKAPDIIITPEDSKVEKVKVTVRPKEKAREIYIRVGNEEYKKYDKEIEVTDNVLISAYYINEEGKRSNTANKVITNIKKGNLPYVKINADPYPYPTDTGRKQVIVTIETSDAEIVEYSEDGINYKRYTEDNKKIIVTKNGTIYARATNKIGTTEEKLNITNIGSVTSAPDRPKNDDPSKPSGGNSGSNTTPGGDSGSNTTPGGDSGSNTTPGGDSGSNTTPGGDSGSNTTPGGDSGSNTTPGGDTGKDNPEDGKVEDTDKYTILNKDYYYLLKLKYPPEAVLKEYKIKDGEWKEYDEEGILIVKPEHKDQILDENGNLKGKIQDEKGQAIDFSGTIHILDIDYGDIYENISIRWNAYPGEAPKIIPSTKSASTSVTIGISYNSNLVKKQYKLKYADGTESEWKNYSGPFTIEQNQVTIYARGLSENEVWTKQASYTIKNIDIDPPEIAIEGDLEGKIRNLNLKIKVTDKNDIEVIKFAEGKHTKSYFSEDGETIQNYGRKLIQENGTYTIYAKDSLGNDTVYEFEVTNIDESAVPNPIFTLDKEPYVFQGIDWYPYGTKLTITYAEDMTNLIGYYSSNGGKNYSSNSRIKTRIETLSETKTWSAKIVDTTGEESEVVTEEIHVMADPYSLQTSYKVVGNVYPVLVTGSNSGSTVYGTDVYSVDSSIQRAAVHMGLVSIGEEKLLKIKVVECPEEGYISSTRNGISSSSTGYGSGASYYGFVFIGDNGEEIKGPTIESISQVPADNEITIGIEAQAYTGAEIDKYYYKIDKGEYVESDSPTYTFTDVQAYVNHTIKVYVKDTRGSVSKVETITQRTANKIATPVFTFDKEPYEIDGIKWYPSGTKLTITYADNMTNLIGYYSSNGGKNYSSNSRIKTRIETLSETKTWSAKIVDTTGEESEVVTEEIHVMADPYSLQTSYKVVGNVYPVLVTGSNSGSTVYGTDVYSVDSSIQRAAVHMGLVSIGEEKLLKIKVVECPEEGYISSTRNGISSSSTGYGSGASYYGFVFIGDNGEEIKGPTIESILSSKKNAIEVKNNAKAYNGATIEKYYYSINNGQYVESTQNSYTFTGLTEGTEYTIKTYAKDSNNSSTIITENKTMTGDFPDGLTVIKSSGNLTSYRGRNNLILGVLVTGSNSGSLWGTETYTDDSSLAAAVVHMGIAKANQTVLVKVQILPGQESYTGTTQNGITSSNYSSYSGSYKILDGGPTIESITQVPADNEITIGIEAQAFRNKSISKYYYKLDDGEYIESSSATYTFSNIEPYVIHKVSVYAKDTEGFSSEEKTINIKVSGKVTLSGYSLIYNNDYGFVNDGDTVVPNNIGIHGTTANSYIVIDLSNYSEDSTHTVSIEAEVSSENNYDFGYATLTTDSTAPAYNSEEGRFVYISGTVENQKYTLSDIAGGKKYYLHLGYRKDGSNNSGDDKVIFRNLEVQ